MVENLTGSASKICPPVAWIEVDLNRLRQNFRIILDDMPPGLRLLVVVKDQAYGHGALKVAETALEHGAAYLAVVTMAEALELREQGIAAPILLFGERSPEELQTCLNHQITCFINNVDMALAYNDLARSTGKIGLVQVEVDTGLSRYGVRWNSALPVIRQIAKLPSLQLDGVMSHFAMSDEEDRSFAYLQLQRFQEILSKMERENISVSYRHMCNTGGYLNIPDAHLDMVRSGILPLGIYPSSACRRLTDLRQVMSLKARVATVRDLQPGDNVGYGLRYQAQEAHRIAVIPIGYGDGYPRVRNTGEVLIHGQRAAIIGGLAMDAMMVDCRHIPQTQPGDEVVLMGEQGSETIDVHDLARLKNSVSYDVLTGFSWRLPRVYLDQELDR